MKNNNIHKLHTDVLWIVFEFLSQRDLINGLGVDRLWYSSIMQFRIHQATVVFDSSDQLKRFIDTANDSVTFDLCKVVLNFPIDNHTRLLSTLIRLSPRLQRIITENDYNPYPLSMIKTPTTVFFNHVNFWYNNSFIIKINAQKASRRRLKTLDYSLGSNPSFGSSIRLQSIGPMKTKLNRDSIQVIDYYSKVLLMPTLNHLVSLRLALKEYETYPKCYEYEMDEKILQSINQSCPKLESLYLFDYFMNISDEYGSSRLFDNSNNGIQCLKSFGMTGAFFDVRCCFLLNLMYPHLESFEYMYSYQKDNGYDYQYLQSAFCDMIKQFTFLKRLSLRSLSYDTDHCKFWPEYSFVEFLNNHPDRFTSLDYPDCLYPDGLINGNSDNDIIIIPNGLFLHNLSFLTMRSKELIKTITNYFLHHDCKLTISVSIKELKIYDDKHTDDNGLYMFDWFILFPALDTLKIQNQVLVDHEADETGEFDEDHECFINRLKSGEGSRILHQMIEARKHKRGIKYSETRWYKLETLELDHVKIKYTGGLTSLFVNFYKLNQLVLKHIQYFHFGWQGIGDLPETITSIYLNISHLCLDYILITDIRIHNWNKDAYYIERLVKKIKLIEYSTGKKSDCFCELPSSGSDEYSRALFRCHPNTFTFKLFCNYVDQFIFF
ncbi:unnamed protein product [Cunninghamella blakesleeana]